MIYEIKDFSQFFTAFLKSTFNFKHLENKDEPHSSCLSGIIDLEIRAYKNV